MLHNTTTVRLPPSFTISALGREIFLFYVRFCEKHIAVLKHGFAAGRANAKYAMKGEREQKNQAEYAEENTRAV